MLKQQMNTIYFIDVAHHLVQNNDIGHFLQELEPAAMWYQVSKDLIISIEKCTENSQNSCRSNGWKLINQVVCM